MCFFKTTTMHDLVIDLCIKRHEFGTHLTWKQQLWSTFYEGTGLLTLHCWTLPGSVCKPG
jgi:hypothetical protein